MASSKSGLTALPLSEAPLREARHRLDAGGDEDVALAGADGVRGHADGLERRGAVAIDGHAGHVGEPGEQRGDARDVEARLAGRLAAADHEVLDALGVEFGQLGQHRAHDERGEVVGTHVDERALEGPSDGVRPVATMTASGMGPPQVTAR